MTAYGLTPLIHLRRGIGGQVLTLLQGRGKVRWPGFRWFRDRCRGSVAHVGMVSRARTPLSHHPSEAEEKIFSEVVRRRTREERKAYLDAA